MNIRNSLILPAALLLLNSMPTSAIEATAGEKTSAAPVIDGSAGDAAWERAVTLEDFHLNTDASPAKKQTSVKLLYDDKHLYLAFTCLEPEPQKLRAASRNRDSSIWRDDCVEVFIDAGRTGAFHHFMVNSKGIRYDAVFDPRAGSSDPDWNGDWSAKTTVGDGQWTAEIAIPFSDLGLSGPPTGAKWGFNLCRECYTTEPPEHSTWSPVRGAFGNPAGFGTLIWR